LPVHVFCSLMLKRQVTKKSGFAQGRRTVYTWKFLPGDEAWIGLLRGMVTLKSGTTRVR
jgi:hypothetical protein